MKAIYILRLLSEEDHHEEEEHGLDDHGDEGNIVTVKIIVCILILLSGCFVFFPYLKAVKDRKAGCCKGKFFSLLTCFAAGMLLTISLVHIMPEALAMYTEYLEEHEKEEAGEAHDDHRLLEEEEKEEEHGAAFPLPYVIFLAGFMLMLVLDQVIFKVAAEIPEKG